MVHVKVVDDTKRCIGFVQAPKGTTWEAWQKTGPISYVLIKRGYSTIYAATAAVRGAAGLKSAGAKSS